MRLVKRRIGVLTALIAFGISNAILYASLLPLWEGFDEPFHYGYVRQLSTERVFPQLGKTALPADIWASLQLAPGSHVVKQNLPFITTFSDYFRLPEAVRHRLREQLQAVRLSKGESQCLNYEAQQAPLAYVLLSAADVIWPSSRLVSHVLWLRLLCGTIASVTTAVFLVLIARRLKLQSPFAGLLVFIVLSSQMFYATTAHVANDWLAIPLMLLLLERLMALQERSTRANALLVAFAFSAALLTKAYFLALIPIVAGVLLTLALSRRLTWRAAACVVGLILAMAGPWYLRNLRLYANLTGMHEMRGGTDWHGLGAAFLQLPWIDSLRTSALASQWTGNNSSNTFSAVTLSLLLAGFVTAALLYLVGSAVRRRRRSEQESMLLWTCIVYGIALLYSTTLSFWFTKGAAITATPWYTEAIVPVVVSLLLLGLMSYNRLGSYVVIWLVCLSAYILCATYWAKLIPLYSGYPAGRMVLGPLMRWYYGSLPVIVDRLSTTAMANSGIVLALAALVTAEAAALSVVLSFRLLRSPKVGGDHH